MKRTFWVACLVFLLVGCHGGVTPLDTATPASHIVRHPAALPASQGSLTSLPTIAPNDGNPFLLDLRGRDLSSLDLHNNQAELERALFDTATLWPAQGMMPAGFDPQRILELGRVPGPGLSQLHAQGITGKGVSIGIVDSTLLVGHQEYTGQLRWYEEINTGPQEPAFMHGPAVASIAVGKTVGVAPEANLYFIGQNVTENTPGGQEGVNRGMAQGILRLLEINAGLPPEQKIRVISISLGMGPGHPGWEEFEAALAAADAQGVLVIYIDMDKVDRGSAYNGLGRLSLSNPEDFASYQAGTFWANYDSLQPRSGWIFVPMDARTLAAPTGADQYVFYRFGGLSWGPPYLAGVYALAVQVDTTMTPERFWDLAQRTGRPVSFPNAEGVILDPLALIQAVCDPNSIPTPTALTASTLTMQPAAINFPKIDRSPAPEPWPGQKPDSEPIYDPASMYVLGLDLSNNDLSDLNLSGSLENLLMASFDTLTTWPQPEKLPTGFDPQQILEWGKNPGPGVRGLHEQGITGQGTGIAFIGPPILVGHQEIVDRLRLYEESEDALSDPAGSWSTMPVSIAAGKTTGVAPGANLYYIATNWGGYDANGAYIGDMTYAANAIRRLLAINAQLPQDRKIRSIVLMSNADDARRGEAECKAAINEARSAGMLVIESTGTGGDGRPLLGTSEGFVFEGLGRSPIADPELFESYGPWGDLTRYQYSPDKYFGEDQLFFPADSRTLANTSAVDGYTFFRQSASWQTGTGAYIAGAFALAAQVNPDITPARFFELAAQTGRYQQIEYAGKTYKLGPILDLPDLIETLKNR